jgi:hypothetical protein
MQGNHGGGATNNGTQEEEGSQEGIFLEDLVIGCIIDDKGRKKRKIFQFIGYIYVYMLITFCMH